MLEILVHTPLRVWAILAALLWLGLSQTAARRASLYRIVLLPLAMTGLSLWGSTSCFSPVHWSWVLWSGATLATAAWFASSELPADVHYDTASRVFSLPGSWVPLGLMMAIFLIRYVVGVALAIHPELTHDVGVTALVASLYGALSGVFIGRMVLMLRKARGNVAAASGTRNVVWG